MRLLQVAGAIALLFLVLTWSWLRAIDHDNGAATRTLAALDRFAMLEAALERDALSARAGVLRNYDTIAREADALADLTGRLGTPAAGSPNRATGFDRLTTLVGQQATVIEQFKSNNALLQNSLAYFRLFSSQLGQSKDPATVAAVTALDAAMLQLTLDTSSDAVRAVGDRLARLAALPPEPDGADARTGVLAHGNLLEALLPRTDSLLAALRGLPIRDERDALRGLVLARQAELDRQERRVRLLLYGFSVILVGLLIHLALKLHARARALRERALFDHLVADISMRFLNAPTREIDAEIERSLAAFATGFGAGRAYFLASGTTDRAYVWRDAAAPEPAEWLEHLPALVADLGPQEHGVIHVARPSRLPAGAARTALTAARIAGWLCMTMTDDSGARRILGFDAFRPGRLTDRADLAFARPALDVLSNAVARDGLERERAQLSAKLQQARRMETIGALASGIAHNFNNLIGAILGYSEMAQTDLVFGSRFARNLKEIQNAGERARELVGQILTFGRPRHVERTLVRLDELLAEAASLLGASLPDGIGLTVRDGVGRAAVEGEPAQLLQVVVNLCNNAAQATSGGGEIELSATGHTLDAARMLDHGTLAAGSYVQVTVSDNGAGMSEAVLARIFEPFYTTRPAGNGLGLATVREIVLEHGGGLEVSSRPGHGSRFGVWLPRAPEAARAISIPAVAAPDRLTSILLVDENQGRLERDEEILAAIGHEPVGFGRPADALAACRAAPDRFDVLIVGQGGSLSDLVAFVAALRDVAPHLPILLAAGNVDGIDAAELAGIGIREIVCRPLDPADIASALRRSLGLAEPRALSRAHD